MICPCSLNISVFVNSASRGCFTFGNRIWYSKPWWFDMLELSVKENRLPNVVPGKESDLEAKFLSAQHSSQGAYGVLLWKACQWAGMGENWMPSEATRGARVLALPKLSGLLLTPRSKALELAHLAFSLLLSHLVLTVAALPRKEVFFPLHIKCRAGRWLASPMAKSGSFGSQWCCLATVLKKLC